MRDQVLLLYPYGGKLLSETHTWWLNMNQIFQNYRTNTLIAALRIKGKYLPRLKVYHPIDKLVWQLIDPDGE